MLKTTTVKETPRHKQVSRLTRAAAHVRAHSAPNEVLVVRESPDKATPTAAVAGAGTERRDQGAVNQRTCVCVRVVVGLRSARGFAMEGSVQEQQTAQSCSSVPVRRLSWSPGCVLSAV